MVFAEWLPLRGESHSSMKTHQEILAGKAKKQNMPHY